MHAYIRLHTHICICNVTHAGMRARTPVQYSPIRIVPHTDTRAQTHSVRANTDTHTHTRAHHTRACVCARACTHAHERATHIPTYARRRALAAVCARARSAAGPRRSMRPLSKGTRRWWRRCSRTAPTCTRRTMTGTAAGRHFGATVGVRRAGRCRPGRDRRNAVLA